MGAEQFTFNLKGRHLKVLIPVYTSTVPIEFMASYVETLGVLHSHNISMSFEATMGCADIVRARNELLHKGVESGADHLMFLDSDLKWKPNDVLRLLAWNTECDVISGNYPTKSDTPRFHTSLSKTEDGKYVQGKYGLFKADAIPGGFWMITKGAAKEITQQCEKYIPYNNDKYETYEVADVFGNIIYNKVRYGEDIAFCIRWRNMGGEIWVDPQVTVEHIGRKIYSHSFWDYLNEGIKDATKTF